MAIKQVITVLAIVFLTPWCLHAEDEDILSAPHRLDEITVTARPVIEGSTVTRHGDKVSVVSVRQIDDLNAQDMPSALRRVPGVTISRYNMIGSYGGADGGTIFIRGHGSGRPGAEISTMVDGIPRFVGVWSHPLMDIMSIDIADRIAIHKSAQPVLFGNTSFGVVNVITKRILHEGFTGRFQSTAGSYGTLIERIEHGGKVQNFDYYISGSHRQSNGHRENSDGEVQALYGRIGYTFNDRWDATFQISHTNGWAHDPGIEGVPSTSLTERYTTDNELYIASVAHTHKAINGSVKLYYEDGFADWRQWDDETPEQFNSVTDYDNYGIRIKEILTLFENNEIIIGLDHDMYGGDFVEKRDSGNKGEKAAAFRNTAPYVMISHQYNYGSDTQIVPSLGMRYNMSRYFGNQVGAQAGLRINHGNTLLYTNAARSYNLPGVYAAVQYDTYWKGMNGVNTGKWKDLKPELLNHYEIGITRIISRQISGDLSIFYEKVIDGLRFVSPPPPPPRYDNIGNYTARGIEASVNYEPLTDLDIFTGVTYMNTTPDDVPNSPEITVSSGIGYTLFRKLRINCDAEYIAQQYVLNPRFAQMQTEVDDYILVNLRIGYLMHFGTYLGELFVAAENITDETYEYRPGYPMPGTTLMSGLDIRM